MTAEEPKSSYPRRERDDADALAALVRSSDDAIYSKDASGIITSWNPAAERLYGYTYEEAVGQPISMLIPPDRKGEELDILHQVLAGHPVDHYQTRRSRKDGGLIDVSVSVSPVHDAQGRVVEAAVIARDITRYKQLQSELEETRVSQAAANRRRALLLNDAIVQGLATAKLALETGQGERALKFVATALERAKEIVTGLLEEGGAQVEPGDLVRDTPAALDD